MMRAALIRWGVVAATFASCAAAYGQDAAMTASVTKFASSYSSAVLKKDVQTVVASMYPAFRAHVGGVEKSITFYRDAPPSIWPIAEKLGEPELCSAGALDIALVKASRTLRFLQGPIDAEHTYVFVSSDKGTSWSVVDQGCTNAKTVAMISPELVSGSCGKKMVARFFPE
jgi:hypothetical protein